MLVPVLVLLVLFVLWAGRGGRAALTVDLAAEEAAVVAALCCDERDEEGRERAVESVLASRPGLGFLCVGGPRPVREKFVSQSSLYFDPDDDPDDPGGGGSYGGVGVLEVEVLCESDGAVAPLRGVFPVVPFVGRATEVVLLAPPLGAVAGVPFLRVSDARAVESEGSMTFTLSLDRPARADITVSYQTMAGSAVEQDTVCTSGGDYRRAGGTATIFAGQRGVEVKVEVCNDDIHEMAEETFLLRLSQPFGATLDRFVATGTIVDDDDAPEVSVHVVAPGWALEGEYVHFEVTLTGGSEEDVRVRLETAEVAAGSAKAGDDYEVRPTGDVSRGDASGEWVWVDFPVGDTGVKTVSVQTLPDELDEPSEEYFEVQLSLPENATVGVGVATGTIVDDDEPVVSISDGQGLDLGDGTTTEMIFDVTLERSTAQDVTVKWTTSEDPDAPLATGANEGAGPVCGPGDDYLGASGMVRIQRGEVGPDVRPTVTVCGNNDPNDPDDDADEETFLVALSEETNATLVRYDATLGDVPGDDVGVGTIYSGGPPFVRISSEEEWESAGKMTFTVELTWPNKTDDVTVGVATKDGTAVAGDDYTSVLRPVSIWPVTIASGDTTATVDVDLVNDDVKEPEEYFDVELSQGTGHRPLDPDDSAGRGRIKDDDSPPEVNVAPAHGPEGDLLGFEVTLSNPSATEVTVDFSTGTDTTPGAHQATAGSACGPPGVYLDHVDYIGLSDRTVTFDVDPTTKVTGTAMTIHVLSCGDATDPDVGDGIDEWDETFTATLSNVSSNAKEGKLTATGTIEDDDPPPVITVARADTGRLDDAVVEGVPPEFVATLSHPSSRRIQVSWSTHDREEATAQAWERAISGRRHANGVDVDYGVDYLTNDHTVDFPPGAISDTIYVSSIDDNIDEQRESFLVRLAKPVGYDLEVMGDFSLGTPNFTAGLIDDNDLTPVVSIVADDAEGVTEGKVVGFTVSLDRPSSRMLTVDVTKALHATGAHPATSKAAPCADPPPRDYRALVDQVTFTVEPATGATTPTGTATPPTAWTQPVEVQSCDDRILEYPETFLAQLANPSDGTNPPAGPLDLATALNDRQAVGTILDDETPQLTILPAHALEGAVVTFEVVLNGLIERELEVTLQAEDYSEDDYQGLARPGDPGDPGDYNPKLRSGSLTAAESLVVTFPADNEDSRAISVRVRTTDDDLHEFNERFALRDQYTLPSFEEPFEAVTFGTIINDDPPPVVVVAPADPDYAVEGGAMRFTVSLLSDPDDPTSSTGAGRPITVHYATDQRDPVTAPPPIAIGGGACGRPDAPDTPDYVNKATYDHDPDTSDDDPPTLDGVLTFAVDPGTGETYAHQLSRTVEVITCVDDPTEGEETFLLHLANPDEYLDGFDVDVDLDGDDNDEANLADLDGDNTDDVAKALMRGTPATGKIHDGDCATLEGNPPTVTADSPAVSVGEANDSVQLTFTLSPAFCEGVSGALLANTRDGAPGVDPATGEAEGIAAVLDPLEATACVTDVGDYVNVADYVTLADSEVTAVGGADTLTLSVRLCPDVIDEGDGGTYGGVTFHDKESFEVALTWNKTVMTGSAYGTGEVAVAAVTITDDDTSVVSVAPHQPGGVIEGNDVEFTVTMGPVNSRDVTVGYYTAHCGTCPASATAGEDYTAEDTDSGIGAPLDVSPDELEVGHDDADALLITAGDDRATISVTTLTDELTEVDEYFRLVLHDHEVSDDVSGHVSRGDVQALGKINDGYCINPANEDHPIVRLNDIDDVTVDENAEAGTVELVVTTSRRFCDPQSFRYTTGDRDDTALAGHDYNAYTDADATLPAETTEFTLSLPTILIDDPIDEADTETFKVEVRWGEELVANNQNYSDERATATVTISDDDAPPQFVVADARANEGDDVTFTVSLADPNDDTQAIGSGRVTTVNYTTLTTETPRTGTRAAVEGTECGVDDVDYLDTTGTLTFPVDLLTGRTPLSVDVEVPSCLDEVPEGTEVFLLELSAPSADAILGDDLTVGYIVECVDPGSATVTPPDIILRDGGYRVGESEGRVEIVVDLSAPFCVRTEMRVRSEAGSDDGSAVGGGSVGGVGDDYANLVHGTIVFQEKQLTGSIRLHIWDDMIDEADESFTILADWNAPDSPPLYSGVEEVRSPVTIIDDDTSAVSVQPSFASEGDPVQFPVTMDLENSRDVTVHYYTLDHDPAIAAADPNINPAIAGLDYDPVAVEDAAAYVTIRAGQTEAETTIDVATTPSTDPEPAETFLLQLRDPTIALLGTPAQTVGTIYDCINVVAARRYNPHPDVPIPEHLAAPTLTLKFAEGVEGEGPMVVQYETSAPLCEEGLGEDGLSFIWDIDPIQGADVRELLGDQVADEEALEALAAAAEAYHLWAGSPESWYHRVDPRIDPEDRGRLSLVEWYLNGAPQPPVSALFEDASAVHRGEFDRLGPILPGEISGEIEVPIRDDKIDELDEIFVVEMWWDELSGAPQWWLAYQERRQGSILLPARIIDDDTSSVSVRDGTGPEGGDVRFRVSLDKLNSRPVTVSYVVGDDPDATHPATGVGANVDYVARSDTVTIPPGRWWREITVPAWSDTLNDEPDETFRVTLTGAVSGADHPNPEPAELGDATAVGTITSCLDLATTTARPQLLINPRPVIESDEVLRVDLVLNTGLCANSAVSLRFVLDMEIGDEAVGVLEDSFGFEHGEYTKVSHGDLDELEDPDDIVWINPGEFGATFEVPVSDDDIDEDDELFGITAFWWSAIRGDGDDFEIVAFDGVPYKGWGTLYDDDRAVLKLDDSGAAVGEGENAVFRVFVDPPRESTHDIVFYFETRDLETGDPETWATAGQDYRSAPADAMRTITAADEVEGPEGPLQEVDVPVWIFVDSESEPDEKFLFEITEARDADLDADVIGEGLIANCVNPDVATDEVATLSIVDQNLRTFEFDGRYVGSAVITVEPSLIVCEDMTITLDYADGTATGRQDGREDLGADYVTLNPSYRHFVLPARARSLEVEVHIVVDWVDEPDETFTVMLSWHEDSPPAYADQEAVSATVTITDSDYPPYIRVEDASGGEGENITFEVFLGHPTNSQQIWHSERPITLRYTTRGTGPDTEGGATEGAECGFVLEDGSVGDFVGVTDQLTFPLDADTGRTPGSATFTVETCYDADFTEGDETFSVELVEDDLVNARPYVAKDGSSSTVAEGTIGSCVNPALGGQAVPELVVLDPDTPGLAIGEAVYEVGEGDGGTLASPNTTIVPVTVGFGVEFCDDAAVGLSFKVLEGTADRTQFGDRDGDFWLDKDSWEMGPEGVHSLEVSWRNAVLIVDDDIDEPDETLTYAIRWDQDVMPPHYWDEWKDAPVRIEVKIADDDTPVVSLAAVDDAKATEGGVVEFLVSMEGVSSRDAQVQYRIRGEPNAASPAALSDLEAPSSGLENWGGYGWVTIPAEGSEATISVRTRTDFVNEGDETFEVSLTGTVWGNVATVGSPSKAVGTIIDSPCVNLTDTSTVPEIVVPDETRVQEDAGRPAVPRFSTRRLMTVRFDPPFCEGSRAEIGYYTENDTAVGAAGLPSGLRTYSDTDAVQLVDGVPFVWDFWHTLRRTSSQELPFSAELSDGGGEVTVPVAVLWDRLDEANEEYTMVLDWHPDMPAHYHAAGVTDGRARIVIRDDDPAPVVSVGDGAGTVAGVAEGATMTFEVVLDRPSGRPAGDGEATVDWAVTGTGSGVATSDDDFAGATSGTLSFPAGAGGVSPTVQTITFDTHTDDDAGEGPETITVTLSNPQNLTLATGGGAVAAGAIYDGVECVDPNNSDHVPATLGFANSAVTVIEGATDARAVFRVTVDPPLCSTATATRHLEIKTFNGTAVADPDDDTGDYREFGDLDDPLDYARRNIDVAVNGAHRVVRVPIIDDALDEEVGETFTLQVRWDRGVMPARYHHDPVEATATIIDDDPPPLLVVGDAAGYEGGSLRFAVSLDAPSAREVSVHWQTAAQQGAGVDAATGGVDYESASGKVVFAPGETATTITVDATADTDTEGTETFIVDFSEPHESTDTYNVRVVDATAVGTIHDPPTCVDRHNEDHPPPALSVTNRSRSEGSGTLPFRITATPPMCPQVNSNSGGSGWFRYRMIPATATTNAYCGTGTTHADWDWTSTATDWTLGSISSTRTSPTYSATICNDEFDEDDETMIFEVRWASAMDDHYLGLPVVRGVGVIVDDDDPPSVSLGNAEGDEGDDLTFEVTLNTASALTVTVDYATATRETAAEHERATFGDDLLHATGTVTIPAGELTATITIPTIDDDAPEATESFLVHLSNQTNAVLATQDGGATAVGRVRSQEPFPTVHISSPTADEGDTLQFRVSLSAPINEEVIVTGSFVTTGPDKGTATDGDLDGTTLEATYWWSIEPNVIRIVSVKTKEDFDVEPDETVVLRATSSPNGRAVIDDSVGTGTGTIRNDDVAPVAPLCAGQTEPPAILFSPAPATWWEGSAESSVTVLIWPELCGDATVTVRTESGTGDNRATPGVDFGEPEDWDGTLTISPGVRAEATYWVKTDDEAEGDECFTIIANWHTDMPAPFQASDIEDATATVRITEDLTQPAACK